MPRIDPAQLLNCLQILLSPTGGILSEEEVHRLASLMTKFSKKLVSKCVYVLILKNTEKRLLNLFMGCGGWTLIQLWLHDAMYSSNWVLVKELLELLILTPVDVERLKSNNIPKLVKSLSKREDIEVSRLASQLVQQWLKIVKDETQSEQQRIAQALVAAASSSSAVVANTDEVPEDLEQPDISGINYEDPVLPIPPKAFYKLSLCKHAHASNETHDVNAIQEIDESATHEETISKESVREKLKDDKKKSHDKSKHRSSSSSSSSKSSKSSHKDKYSSSSSKDRDKSRHHSSRDKDKHRSNGTVSSHHSKSSKSSSNSSRSDKDKREPKNEKDKQIEKDQDTLHQIQPPSIHKLPKIPKKSSVDDKNKETNKGSISIEVRKNTEERPKTVKVYKSKMRSTGLEEEAKPAPPRTTKKPAPPAVVPPIPPVTTPVKRSSPIREISGTPPEKKSKIEIPVERPGAIKLIPPKPKPAVLQESDMFMDALTAATTKKEPKKRKRRASASKDSGTSSPPHSPTLSPAIKNMSPPKFYQDTLQTEESNKPREDNEIAEDAKENLPEAMDESARPSTPVHHIAEENGKSDVQLNVNGLKSSLVYTRRKGPKKSISWKADDQLVDVRYFELDESERVNVTRAFGDMAKMDVRGEREAIQLSRKLQNEDVMEAQTVWKIPTEIDLPTPLTFVGAKSYEREIQFAREKTVLQALYYNKRMVPDSPAEPDVENFQVKDPILIPTEDAENPEHDFRNTPWPEPKGSPPRAPIQSTPPILFHNPPQPTFHQNMPVPQQPNFPIIQPVMNPIAQPQLQFTTPQPHFVPQQQSMAVADWTARNIPANIPIMVPNMAPPELLNQMATMNAMYIPTPEQFNPAMNDVNHRLPSLFNQATPPPGIYQQNNFNHQPNPNRGGHGRGRGGGNYGNYRRGGGGGGGWMRMSGPPQNKWHKNPRGHNRRGGGGGGSGNYDRGYTGNADMY